MGMIRWAIFFKFKSNSEEYLDKFFSPVKYYYRGELLFYNMMNILKIGWTD